MHAQDNHAYAVVLGPAALRVVHDLDEDEKQGLAQALRSELEAGPHVSIEVQFHERGETYRATVLSFCGYTAIHRAMSLAEMERLAQQEQNSYSRGFYVTVLLAAESAVRRWPRRA